MITIEKRTIEMFPRNVKMMRETRALSTWRVAAKAAMPQSTWHAYESGRRMPPLDNFVAMCTALDCTPNELLGY